MKQQYTKL